MIQFFMGFFEIPYECVQCFWSSIVASPDDFKDFTTKDIGRYTFCYVSVGLAIILAWGAFAWLMT